MSVQNPADKASSWGISRLAYVEGLLWTTTKKHNKWSSIVVVAHASSVSLWTVQTDFFLTLYKQNGVSMYDHLPLMLPQNVMIFLLKPRAPPPTICFYISLRLISICVYHFVLFTSMLYRTFYCWFARCGNNGLLSLTFNCSPAIKRKVVHFCLQNAPPRLREDREKHMRPSQTRNWLPPPSSFPVGGTR